MAIPSEARKAVLGHARASTPEQGSDSVGLAAQRGAIEEEAGRRGWLLLDVFEDVASGSKLFPQGLARPSCSPTSPI